MLPRDSLSKRHIDTKMNPGEWVTATGKTVRIQEMDDNHLFNTIRVLEGKGVTDESRKYHSSHLEKGASSSSVETDEYVVSLMEARFMGVPNSLFEKYNELVEEREKRIRENSWHPEKRSRKLAAPEHT